MYELLLLLTLKCPITFVYFLQSFKETWYTAPSPSGKSISGGKLPEKLRNTWRTLKSVNAATKLLSPVPQHGGDSVDGMFDIAIPIAL